MPLRRRSPSLKRKQPKMKTDKILTYLGLAAAKRSVVLGSDLVLREVRRKSNGICVLLASDASERTTKQICDKCAYYKVSLIRLDTDMETLGARVGKISPTACAAVTDRGLASRIVKCSQES